MKISKKTVFYFAVFVLGAFGTGRLFTNNLYAESGGPQAYKTGAPGDGTCNVVACHDSFALNSGGAVFSIKAPATCKPGKKISIKVSFAQTVGTRKGFEMTALDATGRRVGVFKNVGNTTQVIPPNDRRGLLIQDRDRYIEHTSAGVRKKSWTVKWTVPVGAVNPITFYASGTDADGNGDIDNDRVYTATANTNAR